MNTGFRYFEQKDKIVGIFDFICDTFKHLTEMKKYSLLMMICLGIASTKVYAQTEEEALTKTVNDFLEGGTNGEVERFKGAFVRDAVQKTVGSNGVTTMSVESLISKIKPNQKMDRTTKILSISYANNAATALTETAYATNKIMDLLNLLKVGDQWKIVSRVYSRMELDEQLVTVGQAAPPVAQPKAKTPAPKAKKVADDGW